MSRIKTPEQRQAWLNNQPGGVPHFCTICGGVAEPRFGSILPGQSRWRHRDTIFEMHDPAPRKLGK